MKPEKITITTSRERVARINFKVSVLSTAANAGLAFQRQVKELRKKRGWTQEELARRAGLKANVISRIENSIHVPSAKTLAALALAFGMQLSVEFKPIPARTPAPKTESYCTKCGKVIEACMCWFKSDAHAERCTKRRPIQADK